MKKYLFAIAALVSMFGLSTAASAAPSIHDQIASRLAPVGNVCLKGEDCASADGSSQMVATAGGSAGSMKAPEDIYTTNCSACHAMGVAGAPAFGVADQWEARLDKGMDVLYSSVINGLAPGMPAKGLCMDCTDEELKAVTDYMVAAVE